MKLLAHLIAADIRHFRLVMAAFLLVAAGGTAVEYVRPMGVDTESMGSALQLAASLLWMAGLFLTLLIVPMVVHAHRLVGSDAFWMTRPIPPRTLLASKLFLLSALFVAIPVACEVVLMIVSRVPARQIAFVAIQTALTQTLWLAVLMAAAALTRNLAGFAMLCGGVLLALILAIVVSTTVMVGSMDEDTIYTRLTFEPPQRVPDVNDPTAALLLMVLTIGAALGLLYVQYLTRLRRHAILGGVAGIAFALAVAALWPWPIFRPRVDVPAWAEAEGAPRLRADPSSVQVEASQWGMGSRRTWRVLQGRVSLAGVEPGWRANLRLVEASIDLDSGSRLSRRGPGFSDSPAADSAGEAHDRSVLRSVLGVNTVIGFNSPTARPMSLMLIRETDLSPHYGASGTYVGKYFVDLSREESAAALPLRPGAEYQHGADRFVIQEVQRTHHDNGIAIRLRRSTVNSVFDRRAPSMYSFYFRNRQQSAAIAANSHPMWYEPFFFPLAAAALVGFSRSAHHSESYAVGSSLAVGLPGAPGFVLTQDLVSRYSPSDDPARPSLVLDSAWIDGAELVIVRTTRYGTVERTLEMKGFRLPERR